MDTTLAAYIIQIVVGLIVLSPVLWLAGKVIAGGKASFFHAVLIVLIGITAADILGALGIGIFASIAALLIWLWLVKFLFRTGWIQALAIALVVVIIYILIVLVLAILLGLALLIAVSLPILSWALAA